MPKSYHTQGVERLAAFVTQFPEWKQLTPEDLKLYGGRFVAGWELPRLCDDHSHNLRILIDSDFPFRIPRVAVFPVLPVLTWPNLEEKGILCLLSEGTLSSVERIEAVALELLKDARVLVNGWHSGTGLERFEDEFKSYWSLWPHNKEKFVSLCSIEGVSRWVHAIYEKNFTVVADDEQTLKSWIANYFTPDSNIPIRNIPLIRISRALRPEEYPDTAGKLISVLGNDKPAIDMLEKHILSNPDKYKKLMLAFPGRSGFGFAGLILPPNAKDVEKGFRKGHTPPQILMKRYYVRPVTGASVSRCDTSWVHGRDHNPDIKVLSNKTVVLLGAGSLGSGVAELLAKIGINKLVIIDPDSMAPENASRHTLGIRSTPLDKASALAYNLAKRFPHLHFESHDERWENTYRKNPAILTSADLIISAIGVWSAESSLNALAVSTPELPPILYGWLEEHATAAHSVVFLGKKGCLRCLTDDKGYPRTPVTKWPDKGTLKPVPMCGGMFQPYGAIELSYAQGLVADLATDFLLNQIKESEHRVWIGQKKLLESDKGEWNPDWIALHGNPENGGRIVNINILSNHQCPICGEKQ